MSSLLSWLSVREAQRKQFRVLPTTVVGIIVLPIREAEFGWRSSVVILLAAKATAGAEIEGGYGSITAAAQILPWKNIGVVGVKIEKMIGIATGTAIGVGTTTNQVKIK